MHFLQGDPSVPMAVRSVPLDKLPVHEGGLLAVVYAGGAVLRDGVEVCTVKMSRRQSVNSTVSTQTMAAVGSDHIYAAWVNRWSLAPRLVKHRMEQSLQPVSAASVRPVRLDLIRDDTTALD